MRLKHSLLYSFQLTYLTRGTTCFIKSFLQITCISTHVPHKRYDNRCGQAIDWSDISTHVPHKRYDCLTLMILKMLIHFNSRTSQEVRLLNNAGFKAAEVFQLTYLTRGTTLIQEYEKKYGQFQLTYLTRGTTNLYISHDLSWAISTHVPHKRYDHGARYS